MVNTPSPTKGGTAWRRRQRRLRAFRQFLWHCKVDVAAAPHHTSRQRTAATAAATQTMSYAPDSAAATYGERDTCNSGQLCSASVST